MSWPRALRNNAFVQELSYVIEYEMCAMSIDVDLRSSTQDLVTIIAEQSSPPCPPQLFWTKIELKHALPFLQLVLTYMPAAPWSTRNGRPHAMAPNDSFHPLWQPRQTSPLTMCDVEIDCFQVRSQNIGEPISSTSCFCSRGKMPPCSLQPFAPCTIQLEVLDTAHRTAHCGTRRKQHL
jgi:hypothetical protein